MTPYVVQLAALDTIPGVSRRIAEVLIAEIGVDMTPFASAERLASWAGMCPGNHASAGKRKSGKTRKGSPWLRRALTEAAHGAARTKQKYLSAQYHRIAARRGGNAPSWRSATRFSRSVITCSPAIPRIKIWDTTISTSATGRASSAERSGAWNNWGSRLPSPHRRKLSPEDFHGSISRKNGQPH